MKKKITTNSRWLSKLNDKPMFGNFVIPKRDIEIPNVANHHGIWISEIPYQMITRFTNENDLIWSQFGGIGTDYYVAKHLNRRCIINDIFPKTDFIQYGDSRNYN